MKYAVWKCTTAAQYSRLLTLEVGKKIEIYLPPLFKRVIYILYNYCYPSAFDIMKINLYLTEGGTYPQNSQHKQNILYAVQIEPEEKKFSLVLGI